MNKNTPFHPKLHIKKVGIDNGFTNEVFFYEIGDNDKKYKFVEKRFSPNIDYSNALGIEKNVNSYLSSLGFNVPKILFEYPGSLYMEFIEGIKPEKEEFIKENVKTLAKIHKKSLNNKNYYGMKEISGMPERRYEKRIANFMRWKGILTKCKLYIDFPIEDIKILFKERDEKLSHLYTLTLRDFGIHNILKNDSKTYFLDFERASHSYISDDLASAILEFPEDEEKIIDSYLKNDVDMFFCNEEQFRQEIKVSKLEKSLEVCAFYINSKNIENDLINRICSKYKQQIIFSLESLQLQK